MDHASRPRIFVGMLTSEAEPWTWARFRLIPPGRREVDWEWDPSWGFECVTLCFFWHDSFRSEVHHISVQLASRCIDIVDIVVQVFDVFRAKILVEVLLWNITESWMTMSAAHETRIWKMILATMTNALLPSCALLQLRYINIVHLLLFCCSFGGNNTQRQRQNRNGSCCLANQLLLGISGCSYERAVLVSLPVAIGACIIRFEKAWRWFPVARNWPQIFMLQSIL